MAKRKFKIPQEPTISHEEAIEKLESFMNKNRIEKRSSVIDMPIAEVNEETTEEISKKTGNSYIQWSVGENGKYIPCFRTVPEVPAGVYELKHNNQLGFYIEKQNSISDDLLSLPMDEVEEILKDIDTFWKRSDVFKRYGYTHKRGILLYGHPGNGKSYLIQLLTQYLIKDMNGIILNLKDYNSVELYLEFTGPIIRSIEPNRPFIVIMEDIDNILEYDRSTLTKVLNMLDGIKQIDKVVYIATTNYPEKLQERVSNRPSRFDRRYKIKKPNAQVREFYIKNKLNEEDLKKIDLKEWVSQTKGLSISHLKELIVSVIIFGMSFNDALHTLKSMSNKINPREDEEQKIGFALKSLLREDDFDESDN